MVNNSPDLKITPQIVAAVPPSKSVNELIAETVSKSQFNEWLNYYYGSGYYVELPSYLNGLVVANKENEARAVIARAFSGNGIPRDDFQKMVQYMEKGTLE